MDKVFLCESGPICLDLNHGEEPTLHQILRFRDDLNNVSYGRAAVTILQNKGLDNDIADSKGNLALHYACMNGHHTALRMLFESTSFPNPKNHDGATGFDLLSQ